MIDSAIRRRLPSEIPLFVTSLSNSTHLKRMAAKLPNCLNVKSEERVVYKRLNSTGTLIQKTTKEAPQALCITSDWMFTRRRSATA